VNLLPNHLPISLIGMNAKVDDSISRICNGSFVSELGLEKEFNVTNPFDFMDMISYKEKPTSLKSVLENIKKQEY